MNEFKSWSKYWLKQNMEGNMWHSIAKKHVKPEFDTHILTGMDLTSLYTTMKWTDLHDFKGKLSRFSIGPKQKSAFNFHAQVTMK